ncbi:MAG TPA: response regulator [Methylomirabilota bacterium]|jgi:signal transduction histidine kinase/DNA-binding response OmpR family regulator
MTQLRGQGDTSRILYIEDDPGSRLLVRSVLERAGYVVLDAEDGITGMEVALRERPALILLDVNLPEVDGYTVATALRTFPKLSEVPIVAVTAYAAPGDRERTLVAGCDGYIAKPIDVDAFPGQVADFLLGKRERAPAGDEGFYLRDLNQRLVCRLLRQLDEVGRLSQEVGVRAQRLEDIHDAVQDLTSELGPAAILERLLPRLARALHATDLIVELSYPPGLRLAAAGDRTRRAGTTASSGFGTDLELKVPLVVRGRPLGFVTARWLEGAGATLEEEHLFKIVANQLAIAMENARLYETERAARTGAETGRWQSAFLAQVSKGLTASLDYDDTLAEIARLAVPELGDVCVLDMVQGDDSLRRAVVAVADPLKEGLASALQRYSPGPAPGVVVDVVRTAQPYLVTDVTESMVAASACDAEHRRILQQLGPQSAMVVPLVTRGRTLGALSLVSLRPERRYRAADLDLAREFAARATDALDNARLYGERQAADRRKDEFLSVLAHELRAPLAPILSAMAIVERHEGDESAVRVARQIVERQVRHQARILDDLLDLARIGRGMIELRRSRVPLVRVVADALDIIRPVAEARRQVVRATLPGEELVLWVDATRLIQVVTNLLGNASKYSPEGGEITIVAGQEGDRAVIRVRDSGDGIAPELLPRVFDPFVPRGAVAGRVRESGLGIGLALVRRLVELHGGTVEAESGGAERGACFTVRLPLGGTSDMAEGEASSATVAPRHILVVEDDPDALQTLRFMLELEGHHVDVASDGDRAIELAVSRRPQVVLLDIGLPGIDGYEVAKRLRQALGPEVLLVALTGYGRHEDQLRALSAGCDAHLLKPVDRELLRRVIAR